MQTWSAVMQIPVVGPGWAGAGFATNPLRALSVPSLTGRVRARNRTVLLWLPRRRRDSDDRSQTQSAPATWRRSEMSGTIGPETWARWRWRALAVGVGLTLSVPAGAAPKTDTVVLTNGDRLTCEIKKLQQARLTISTDPLGTASVHWGEVVAVTTPRDVEG